MTTTMYIVSIATGVLAIAIAIALIFWVRKQDEGSQEVQRIGSFIREGAMAFVNREYRIIFIFMVLMFFLLWFVIGIQTAITFVVGAIFSLLAGYIGMRTATLANVRTASAAQTGGMRMALKTAFRGGAVMGLFVAGLGVIGVSAIMMIVGEFTSMHILTGFSLGASSIALFSRVGGGIYTKAADVGADMVGKVEAGIPEDDPRNPAVIADNVGDNVGDVAGMGSDLFESYVGSLISAIILACTMTTIDQTAGVMFPLLVSAAGAIAAIIAVLIVGGTKSDNASGLLNASSYIASALVLLAGFGLSYWMFGDLKAFAAVAVGVVVGIGIGFVTERYTSDQYKPVRELAEQSQSGPAITIINGFALGMFSTLWPVLLIAVGILLAFLAFGVYGIALASVGMLSIVGIIVTVDTYGPIADNAGGIAQMADMPEDVREITDQLDSVGNTTAAIGKGFAIGSAALTALSLFVSYAEVAGIEFIDLLYTPVVIGLFLGAVLPFLFSSLTMRSVGKAAFQMIEEVRRQFREIPGIMDRTAQPDYARCVDISTQAALKEMIIPGLLAVITPIVVGLVLGVEALGGLLAGALITGVVLAITMANAGGAWDNAKKYIEAGNFGGEGSEAHAAAVVGDTVGDPFKDTSGPSINILIKLMSMVSLVFLPILIR